MAGLYAGLLLRSRGVDCHLFEANNHRVGGRIFTHRFNDEPNQFFEAGAMRLPHTRAQAPVFDLMDWLNVRLPSDQRIELLPYILHEAGNRVLVNQCPTLTLAEAHANPGRLGYHLSPEDCCKSPATLLGEALQPLLTRLAENFEQGFRELLHYDHYSLHSYLDQELVS